MLCIVLKILLYKLVKKQAFRDWKMSITKMHCVKILLKVQRRRTSIPTQNNTVNADTFRVQCNPSLDLRLSMRLSREHRLRCWFLLLKERTSSEGVIFHVRLFPLFNDDLWRSLWGKYDIGIDKILITGMASSNWKFRPNQRVFHTLFHWKANLFASNKFTWTA